MQQRENYRNNQVPKPKRSHRKSRIIILILIILLIGLIVYGAKKYYDLKGAVDNSYRSAQITKERNVSQLLKENKPISILLLGTDTGELDRTYKGRTDSMIIVTLNPKKHLTTMTSIPRDTAISIPGHENDSPSKINAAYTYGSAATAIESVQKLLNIPIDFYTLVNMGGMEELVNKAGGVDITPTLSFNYEGNTFVKGKTEHMNGKKALAYSRMRYDDPRGDYGRQERQRQVLVGLIARKEIFTDILNQSFINTLSHQTQTDLTMGDLTIIATQYHSATKHVEQNHLQGQGQSVGGSEMEVMPTSELQSVTNFIRKSLDLPPANTGHINYGA